MYIYHPNTKVTHKNDGFIVNLMKVPAPLKPPMILLMDLKKLCQNYNSNFMAR